MLAFVEIFISLFLFIPFHLIFMFGTLRGPNRSKTEPRITTEDLGPIQIEPTKNANKSTLPTNRANPCSRLSISYHIIDHF